MIHVQGLWKSFGGQPVLRGIDLDIASGETVAIIGRSGCGKSVLLKHLIGLLQPDSGEISVDGVDVVHARRRQIEHVRRNIGFLFQGAALFDSMNVFENVTLGLWEHGLRDRAILEQTVAEKLELVGLRGMEQRMPVELSGGMRKRVALARSLAMKPNYMFYDEPTTGLDPVTSGQIDQLIEDLTARLSVTSIVITHDMFTVERIARRVVFLHEGTVYFDGTPIELYASDNAVVREFLSRYTHRP